MDGKTGGYAILRAIMGINMFMHGSVRMFGDYAGFSNGVMNEFSGTILPGGLVQWVGWGIPPLEFLIGISLIFGLFTTAGLVAGGFLMAVLVFGMSLLASWGTVANQMLYVLLFSVLLFGIEYNRFSLDRFLFDR